MSQKYIDFTCNVSETYARIVELTNKLEAIQKVFTYRQIVHYRNNYQRENIQLLYLETLEECFNNRFYKGMLETKEYSLRDVSEIGELRQYPLCSCSDCTNNVKLFAE
jgi:hypothetical protein